MRVVEHVADHRSFRVIPRKVTGNSRDKVRHSGDSSGADVFMKLIGSEDEWAQYGRSLLDEREERSAHLVTQVCQHRAGRNLIVDVRRPAGPLRCVKLERAG